MKKVENHDKILEIMRSESLENSRAEFMDKFSIDSDSIFNFNMNFSRWRKADIDIRGFVDLVIKSNPSFNIDDFSIFDLIIEYLKIHLYPIKGLIDENPDDVISVVMSLRDDYQNNDANLGSKEVTPELSDDVYNPFDDPEKIIDEVINVLEIKFSNHEYRDRFYDVCIKFIKNIRNKFQTFEILARAKKDNGVGLKGNVVDEVLGKIEKIKRQAEGSLLNSQLSTLNRDVEGREVESGELRVEGGSILHDLDIGKEDNLLHPRLLVDEAKNNIYLGNKESNKNIEDVNEDGMRFNIFDGSVEEMYLNQIKNKAEISDNDFSSNSYRSSKNFKLIGPIEELAFFTIKDFRNLSQDVFKRSDKIEQKIKVLTSYSARKKVLGIKAWLSSEVCIVYKKMIDESVKYGDMNKVINLRKEKNDLYLTQDEIDSIAQLNRKLRI